MKKAISFFAFTVVALIAISAVGEDKPWIDTDKCIFCRQLTLHEGLMDHMSCEHHDIANGHLMATVVDPEYRPAYIKAQKAMEQIGMDMAQGKINPTEVYMCGSCEAYGGLIMSGVIIEHIPTGFGDIVLLTSDDRDVLTRIKEYGRRWAEEIAKLEAGTDAETSE